jgi:hypothetical protein
MTRSMPTPVLLMAGSVGSVREQLGLSAGDVVEPLPVDQLPLSAGVRQQLRLWAATFVELQCGGSGDDGWLVWSEQGLALAAGLAGESGQDVQFRYLVHSPTGVVQEPVAGLFEDVLVLPPIPVSHGWTAYRST